MTEKELVEKLKPALRKWAGTLKEDLEAEKKAGLINVLQTQKREGLEKLYKEDFERHDKRVLQLEKATQFKQLTSLVRDWSWDAESWISFVFYNAFQSRVEIGDLSKFDT